MDDLTLLRVTLEDGVALVTMDAPPVNAQGQRFHEEVHLAFDRIAERDDIRCAVLTGAGKVFSAGADIRDPRPSRASRATASRICDARGRPSTPSTNAASR